MDIIFGVVGFLLGFAVAKNMVVIPDPTKIEKELQEKNNQLTEDIAYYKKLCKTISEENAEFRRNQK
jgi:hypothetical protein